MSGTTVLGERFTRAVDTARTLYGAEARKATAIPYLSHLLAVAAIVLEHGGDEDQAIAALLHDAAEDHGGLVRLEIIRADFGDDVADLVRACSDSLAADRRDKPPWWERKVRYLIRLEDEPIRAALVSAADKLHNARAVLSDYRSVGDGLWERFNPDAGRVNTLWYYLRLEEIFARRLEGRGRGPGSLAAELTDTVTRLVELVGADHPRLHDELLEAEDHERSVRAHLAGLDRPGVESAGPPRLAQSVKPRSTRR